MQINARDGLPPFCLREQWKQEEILGISIGGMAMKSGFVLKGDICYSKNPDSLYTRQDGFLVCENGRVTGVFEHLPQRYGDLPLCDFGGKLILPGLVDLHCHGPQFAFRGLGLDLELLDWLEAHTFPNEAKYRQEEYAHVAYTMLVEELREGPNTRICLFGTIHLSATLLLMDLLEQSGLVTMVGKVNMDRNCPNILREESAAASAADHHKPPSHHLQQRRQLHRQPRPHL